MKEGERATNLAFNYYDELDSVWMVYFSNDVIDPYYDLAISDSDFNKFITTKYGSIANAQMRTYAYRHNWASNESNLSVSAYNALPAKLKKYWNPILSYDAVITGYERVQEDWETTTNQIISLSTSSNTTFQIDEIVSQNSAQGTVVWSNSSFVTLKHISGQFAANAQIVGSVTANVSDVTIITEPIPLDEQIYWEPVSYFQYESEKNEDKKNIKLVNVLYATDLEKELKNKLNGK